MDQAFKNYAADCTSIGMFTRNPTKDVVIKIAEKHGMRPVLVRGRIISAFIKHHNTIRAIS